MIFPILFSYVFAYASASVINCAPTSTFKITKLVLDPPTTAVAGQNISLTLLYTSPIEINAGTITTSITYNYIPFSPSSEPLCGPVKCPIGVGDHDGSSWFVVPTNLKGNVITKIVWSSQTDDLLCISINLKVNLFTLDR